MRLRGLSGARDEFHLAAIVQNLKTMALRLLAATSSGVRVDCVRGMAIRANRSPSRRHAGQGKRKAQQLACHRAFFDSIDPERTLPGQLA
jgi:hypothetical protein